MPPGFHSREKKKSGGEEKVRHLPWVGVVYLRLEIRLGGFLVSSPEPDCFSCISGMRLTSICGVWTHASKHVKRPSRFVVKSVRSWKCVDLF